MPKAFAALKPNGEFVRIRVVFDPGSEHYFIAYQLSKKPRLYMPFGGAGTLMSGRKWRKWLS